MTAAKLEHLQWQFLQISLHWTLFDNRTNIFIVCKPFNSLIFEYVLYCLQNTHHSAKFMPSRWLLTLFLSPHTMHYTVNSIYLITYIPDAAIIWENNFRCLVGVLKISTIFRQYTHLLNGARSLPTQYLHFETVLVEGCSQAMCGQFFLKWLKDPQVKQAPENGPFVGWAL